MNIGDIARLAGVSSASVSRYFNNGHISEEKRQAISRVVQETGFRPSAQAQTLRTKKTRLVGVIIPRIDSTSMSRMVSGILEVLNEYEYHLVLSNAQADASKENDYLSFFSSRQVDGVILLGTTVGEEQKKRLGELKIPVVILGQRVEGFHCVYHPDRQATRELTRLVLENGSRHPCYMGAYLEDTAVGRNRRDGFLDALKEADMPWEERQLCIAQFSVESGYEMARLLWRENPGMDALVCATDDMAAGAMRFFYEEKISIPDQVQVVGHGNSKAAHIVIPSLTTVAFDYEESGRVSTRILLRLFEDNDLALQSVCLDYCLARRDTTKKKKEMEGSVKL